MAYRGLRIKLTRVSSLRGDGQGDGGYADKSFFVETHVEGETFRENDVKEAIIEVVKPEIHKMIKSARSYKPHKPFRK